MPAPGPVTWRTAPQTIATMTVGIFRGIFRAAFRVPMMTFAALVGLVAVIVVGVVLGGFRSLLAPLGVVAFAALLSAVQLAINVGGRSRQTFVGDGGKIVVNLHYKSDADWAAEGLASWPWPKKSRRAEDFIAYLRPIADEWQAVITGTAGNKDLFLKVYQPAGFIRTSDGPRPKIRLEPRPRPGDAPTTRWTSRRKLRFLDHNGLSA